MQIEVLKVDVENKGKYRQAKVSYKRDDGKVDAKFLVSFANKDVYKTMTEAQPGDAFDVTWEKDEKGFPQWAQVSSLGKATGEGVGGGGNQKVESVARTAVRSSYETPEERAKRQVYIVRQSSISNAIAFLAAREPKGVDVSSDENTVLSLAEIFAHYVFNGLEKDVEVE